MDAYEMYGRLVALGESEFVYFIRRGDYVKIGYSKRPLKRLEQLQTGSPELLELVLIVAAGREFETTLHRTFKRLRYGGEWFHAHPYLLKYIDRVRAKLIGIIEETERARAERARLMQEVWESTVAELITDPARPAAGVPDPEFFNDLADHFERDN